MRVTTVDVAHRFPGTDILFEHLSFTVEPGEVVALCGPSGCGKSTLLSILAGWEKPWAGRIEREGIDRVGWVFQNPYGVANRSALDHVAFPLLAKGLGRKEAEARAREALALFSLEDVADRRFAELSGGEAQRLMLARAVCSHPDMLLVDEPTAQLDTRTAESVSHVLGNLAGQGMIVFVATHDPRTRDACDRVIDLADYAPPEGETEEESESPDTAKTAGVEDTAGAADISDGAVRVGEAIAQVDGNDANFTTSHNETLSSETLLSETLSNPQGAAEESSGEGSGRAEGGESAPQGMPLATALPQVAATGRRMRLRCICSEAHRNLSLGVTHALVFMLIMLVASLLLGGYDALNIIALQNQAVTRVSTMADARDVMGGAVDGVACDELSRSDDVRESGALRSDDSVIPTATPRQEVPVYEVSPGMVQLIADSERSSSVTADATKVWVSSELADLFGIAPGSVVPTNKGTMTVGGVFDWPNDGRDTRFSFAFLVSTSASDGQFQECWAQQWPVDDQLDALLYTTVVADPSSQNVGVLGLNNGYSKWDAEGAYQSCTTRVVPWIGLGVGVACGAIAVMRRRLEYAGALHAGQSRGSLLLGIALETLVWAGLAALGSGLLLAGLCERLCPAGVATVAQQCVRVPVAMFAGAVVMALFVGVCIRESRLLKYFKNR